MLNSARSSSPSPSVSASEHSLNPEFASKASPSPSPSVSGVGRIGPEGPLLEPVGQAVPVGVGVGVDRVAAEGVDLAAVGDAVAVGVGVVGIGAERRLLRVGQAVAVGVDVGAVVVVVVLRRARRGASSSSTSSSAWSARRSRAGAGVGAAGGADASVAVGIAPLDASDGPIDRRPRRSPRSAAVLIRVMLPVRATAEPAVIVVAPATTAPWRDDHEGGHVGVQDEGLVRGHHVADEVDVADAGSRA